MGLNFGDNVLYEGSKPNFDRDRFATLQDMRDFGNRNRLDVGHISYVVSEGKHYVWKGGGVCTPLESGSGSGTGGTLTAGGGIDISGGAISVKVNGDADARSFGPLFVNTGNELDLRLLDTDFTFDGKSNNVKINPLVLEEAVKNVPVGTSIARDSTTGEICLDLSSDMVLNGPLAFDNSRKLTLKYGTGLKVEDGALCTNGVSGGGTGETLVGGNGIDITDGVISVDKDAFLSAYTEEKDTYAAIRSEQSDGSFSALSIQAEGNAVMQAVGSSGEGESSLHLNQGTLTAYGSKKVSVESLDEVEVKSAPNRESKVALAVKGTSHASIEAETYGEDMDNGFAKVLANTNNIAAMQVLGDAGTAEVVVSPGYVSAQADKEVAVTAGKVSAGASASDSKVALTAEKASHAMLEAETYGEDMNNGFAKVLANTSNIAAMQVLGTIGETTETGQAEVVVSPGYVSIQADKEVVITADKLDLTNVGEIAGLPGGTGTGADVDLTEINNTLSEHTASIEALETGKQDRLGAGDGISLSGGVVSVYAGQGLGFNGQQVQVSLHNDGAPVFDSPYAGHLSGLAFTTGGGLGIKLSTSEAGPNSGLELTGAGLKIQYGTGLKLVNGVLCVDLEAIAAANNQ